MSAQPDRLIHSIDHVLVEVTPYKDFGWEARVANARILCSGAILGQEQAEKFLKKAQKLIEVPPLRLSACHVCFPGKEWEIIADEHLWLTWLALEHGLSGRNAHIVLPLDHFYLPKTELPFSEFYMQDLYKLTSLQNSDGWETYCFWVAEEAERILEQFSLEALETYSLEALLKELLHEVRAAMLRYDEMETAENVLRLGVLKNKLKMSLKVENNLAKYEVSLVRARLDARSRLAVQQQLLAKIATVIGSVEKSHPELLAFERQTLLLSLLLEEKPRSWVSQFMLLELLNIELGAVSAVQDDLGFDRMSIAFALQAAIAILKQTVPAKELIYLAAGWDQTPYQGNLLADRLKKTFLEVLTLFSIPLLRKRTHVQKTEWHTNYTENKSILSLIPFQGTLANKEGELIEVAFLHLNSVGQPIGLTSAGHYLFTKLFPKGTPL